MISKKMILFFLIFSSTTKAHSLEDFCKFISEGKGQVVCGIAGSIGGLMMAAACGLKLLKIDVDDKTTKKVFNLGCGITTLAFATYCAAIVGSLPKQ